MSFVRACFFAAFAIVTPVADGSSPISFQTVTLSGDEALGADSGVFFDNLSAPVINSAGVTAFSADLNGAGVNASSRQTIFSQAIGGEPSLIARRGDDALGGDSGVLFSGFQNPPVINAVGDVAFQAILSGPNVSGLNDSAIFSQFGGGAPAVVARAGDDALGGDSGVLFGSFFTGPPALSSVGGATAVAFQTNLFGETVGLGNDEAIFSLIGSGLPGLVVRENESSPSELNSLPVLNAAGDTAFAGGISTPSFAGGVIFAQSGGGEPEVVATSGAMLLFRSLSGPVINAAGDLAFLASLNGTAPVGGLNRAIVGQSGGGPLTIVARNGDEALGEGSGVLFSNFRQPILSSAGDTVFVAEISGEGVNSTSNDALFAQRGGGPPELVAREGNEALHDEAGVFFQSFNDPVANAVRETTVTAFEALLTGVDVNGGNNEAIFAYANGVRSLVVREGDLFDVDDDPLAEDLRTIQFVSLENQGSNSLQGSSGGEDGRPSPLNNRGQLAFQLHFTDGTQGVFVANLIDTTPAPGDYNVDGEVDADDYVQFVATFGNVVAPGQGADGNGDGVINAADYTVWRDNFGLTSTALINTPAANNSVPEPTVVGFLVTVALLGITQVRPRAAACCYARMRLV